jgi:hypothetical protein
VGLCLNIDAYLSMQRHWALQVDKVQEGTGSNHAISALKFKIIREFLDLGWNVLLSDVDIVVVQVRCRSNIMSEHIETLHRAESAMKDPPLGPVRPQTLQVSVKPN